MALRCRFASDYAATLLAGIACRAAADVADMPAIIFLRSPPLPIRHDIMIRLFRFFAAHALRLFFA